MQINSARKNKFGISSSLFKYRWNWGVESILVYHKIIYTFCTSIFWRFGLMRCHFAVWCKESLFVMNIYVYVNFVLVGDVCYDVSLNISPIGSGQSVWYVLLHNWYQITDIYHEYNYMYYIYIYIQAKVRGYI